MVHCSQVAEELSLSRDDEDEAKVQAMEFFCPTGSEVRFDTICAYTHAHSPASITLGSQQLCFADLGKSDRSPRGRWRGLQGCLQHEGMLL